MKDIDTRRRRTAGQTPKTAKNRNRERIAEPRMLRKSRRSHRKNRHFQGDLLVLAVFCLLCMIRPVMMIGSGSDHGVSISAAYDGPCYIAAKYESSGTCETCAYYTVDDDTQFACGEFQFDATHGCLTKFIAWAYEKDPELYQGFAAYLDKEGEEILEDHEAFTAVWQAIADQDYETFECDQCQYEYVHYGEPAFESYQEMTGFDFSASSDAVKAMVIALVNNYGRAGAEGFFADIEASDSELEVIEKVCDTMKNKHPQKYERTWQYIREDLVKMQKGELNIYKKSKNKRADIDWSWKI